MSEKLAKGDRVQTRFGRGTISDDYWAHRDRYTVNYDDGSESDHCADSITKLYAQRTPK
jgi:hypothetical protein